MNYNVFDPYTFIDFVYLKIIKIKNRFITEKSK